MSSLGIGLGSFMGGFEKGYGLGREIEDRKRTDKLRDEADASRAKLKNIETDTKAQFDKGVSSGAFKPEQYDDFWLKYALPKRKMALLEQGDVEGAKALMDWGRSEDALKGGRLFASSLFKAQTGDVEGSFGDAIKAGQLKGYIDHGYTLDGKDDLQQDGKTIGFRVRLKDPDGNITSQDIPVGQLGTAISTLLSPDAAIAQNAAARAAATKRSQDLEDYTTKKKIDQKYSPDRKDVHAEAYSKAHDELLKNDLDFAGLSPEEQDKKVRATLGKADAYSQSKSDRAPGLGRSNRPAPPQKILVDQQTGRPVQAPQQAAPVQQVPQEAAPAQQPVGLGQSPAQQPAATVAPSQGQPVEQQQAPQQAGPAPQRAPSDPVLIRQQMIADAADRMAQGGNPNAIAQALINAGISQDQWPPAIQNAVQRSQAQPGPGLPQ